MHFPAGPKLPIMAPEQPISSPSDGHILPHCGTDNQPHPPDLAPGEWCQVRNDVLSDPRLSPADKLVYWAICKHADNARRRCRVRRETLAATACLSVRAVANAITRLEATGWVSHTAVKINRENHASIYQLTAPGLPGGRAHSSLPRANSFRGSGTVCPRVGHTVPLGTRLPELDVLSDSESAS